uniref:FHA domain-containing protein n=1 Tax=Davidia involucrata TaxID=16924 RepID=A0A5B6ZNQ9_DAVIN
MQCDNMKNSTPSSDDYLAELSKNLLNFTSDEELLADDDGKDGIDKSYIDDLTLLLLHSPDVNDMPNIFGTTASVAAPDEYLSISGGACPGELNDNGQPHYGDGHTICSSEAKVLPSALTVNSQFSELCDGFICCMLNTEDTEIPCNDDVFLPILMPSSSSFAKDFPDNQKTNAGGLSVLKREGKIPEQSHLSSHMIGSQLLQEMGLNHPVSDCAVKFELPNGDCPNVAIMSASTACGGQNQIRSATVNASTFLPATLKDEATEIEQAKHLSYSSAGSYLEKPVHGFDGLVSYLQRNASCSKQEIHGPAKIQNYQDLQAELGSVEMTVPELVVNASPSDHEELPSESDDNIPYFTDIESMILDMDLSPDNQDLYSSREVSRYQHEDSKRTIIRLEQAAHSYMQRVIASRGALAVLYGRHSKHYIKKPEVLLGRATEDDNVDIDLGREGHANKISRRQAIIKMDKGGSFHLKNLGKCSIFVNNKEVTPKQSLRLASSCLIEIKRMPFIFETNQTCVRQYVDNISKESQPQEHKV